MGQIKLTKEEKGRKLYLSNNWIKFFLADLLLSAGITASNYDVVFLGTFGIVGAIGLITSLIHNITKEW